jgi:hypothetical protein
MLYEKHKKTVWDSRIEAIFQDKPKEDTEAFLDIVGMMIYNEKNDFLSLLYKNFGIELFTSFISVFSGKTIEVPKREELRDIIISALCFYYRELEGKNWKEVKTILEMENLKSIKYGRKIYSLKEDIREEILKDFKGIKE